MGKRDPQIYVNGITDHIIRNENIADYIVNFVQKNDQRKIVSNIILIIQAYNGKIKNSKRSA